MFDRKAYHREYKRRRRLDPEYRAKKNQQDRNRLTREKRDAHNARDREKWARDKEYRERQNQRRAKLGKRDRHKPERKTNMLRWQAEYFARHYGDPVWMFRRDKNRVKAAYKITDPVLIEALALVRAFKRKVRKSKSSAGSE